jgi:hypothetical protein
MKKLMIAGAALSAVLTSASVFANDVVHTYTAGPFKTVAIHGSFEGVAAEIFKLFEKAQFDVSVTEARGLKRSEYSYKQISAHSEQRGTPAEYGVEFHMTPEKGSVKVHRDLYSTQVLLGGKMARDLYLIMARAEFAANEDGATVGKLTQGGIECSFEEADAQNFSCTIQL